MANRQSPFSHISKSLSLLKEQEEEYKSITNSALLKDHILSLRLGLPFLEIFLSVSSNEDLKTHIKRVVYYVMQELQSISNRSTDGSFVLDNAYTDMLGKMKNVIVKAETKDGVIFPKLYRSGLDLGKINDFLLQRFEDLSSSKPDLFAFLMEEVERIKEKLIRLQPLLSYLADTEVAIREENKKLLAPFVDMFDKAACLLYSCLFDKMDEEMTLAMKPKLSFLLESINIKEIYMVALRASYLYKSADNPLETEFYLLNNLIKFLDCNIYLNKRSQELDGELKSLATFLVELSHEHRVEKLNYLVTTIEAITRKSIPVLYSCCDEAMKEDMVKEVDTALSEVHEQIKPIQADVREIKLDKHPKTDELGFLDLFLGHLEKLMKCRPELIETLKNQIGILHVEFDFFRSFLRKIKKQHNDREELDDLYASIIFLAYQAEYVIDFYLVNNVVDSRIEVSLSRIMEQIELKKEEVKRIDDEVKYDAQDLDAAKISSHVASQATAIATNEVVGFDDEAREIIDYLVGESEQLNVISIVGMPGLGKTTLAKKIYEDPSITSHFHIRIWCSVAQVYQKEEVLLTILGHVIEVTSEIKKLNDIELAAKLYQSLKGRRYLIIIDDIWDAEGWDDLKRYFPNDKNHSRILMTSRLQSVDETKAGNKVHHLRPFSDDESWELFQKKLSQDISFSEDFLEVGKQIAWRCKGLPLGIVVAAGLLSKVEESVRKWNEIAESLNLHILRDTESPCKAILELSYNHLPDHLRSCFLYIGAFLKDKEIPVRKLKWFWMAEGFVRGTKERNLEYIAEEYFKDLISRSLLTATRERSYEGIKTCRVHDLLRDFCLEKAKEENFLQLIIMDDGSEFLRVYDHHRLSIHSKVYDFVKAKPSGYTVRSLLHTAHKGHFFERDISFISQNFKLLRVLDLTSINIDESFNGIELLVHLRYLAVGARTTSIPSSIANLWNLQFFLVEDIGLFSICKKVVEVPDSLWDMVNLRHVHINPLALLSVHRNRLENSSSLGNLETLSTPFLSYGDDAENLLRRLPKLRKLKCIFLKYKDANTKRNHFPVLDFLGELMSLKVIFEGSSHWGKRCEFNFPKSLEKLTLSEFGLLWKDISKIGRTLPNLKVLKLIEGDWDKKWKVNEKDFPKLKYLKLCNLDNIREWIASEGSFPNLEQLVLDKCKKLQKIPPRFEEIPTLRMIVVKDCQPSVEESARRIQTEQHEEWQNNELKVSIYPKKLQLSF